jgi:hypothetical protein
MKRILIFTLLLFITNGLLSQTQWRTYRNQIGEWNTYTEKWVYGEMNYSDITITFNKNSISMDNRSQSYYKIYKDDGEDTGYTQDGTRYNSHSWRAYDKSDRKCILTMIKYESPEYDLAFTVMYDDVVFRYYYSNSKTDKFNQ